MNHIRMRFSLFVLMLFTFYSCKKEDKDDTTPVITWEMPEPHLYASLNDRIRFRATIRDDKELGEITFTITSLANGELLHFHIDPSGSTYTLDTAYTVNNSQDQYNYLLEVEDWNGNKTKYEHHVHIN